MQLARVGVRVLVVDVVCVMFVLIAHVVVHVRVGALLLHELLGVRDDRLFRDISR